MTALSTDRNTFERSGEFRVLPAAAAQTFYMGAMLALDASGNVTPAATATGLKGIGRCEEFADNSAGLAAAINVKVKTGVFLYENSSGADLIANSDIGSTCYMVDDQTVAKTDGTATRSIAGTVFDIDETGKVWVKF